VNPENPEDGQRCKPIGSSGACTGTGARVIPAEPWKPSCCPKELGCGGVCCQPPNRCKGGLCMCPDGSRSIDGRTCCRRGQRPVECFSGGTRAGAEEPALDLQLVGRKCCPSTRRFCCGSTCCKEVGCCNNTCCPVPKQCALQRGRKVCCPRERLTFLSDQYVCCPAGTLAVRPEARGCCPPGAPECCGAVGDPNPCTGGKICVRGTCVAP
jgi:hypothetical protein